MAAQKLGMDLADTRILCSHMLQYKGGEGPFKQEYTEGINNPIQWWTSIELNPPHLQKLAINLFSICPNSASCERGFSTCGWLSNKRRLKLGVERLESMVKLISYYRSNPSHELGFYGKGIKNNSQKLSDKELNNIVNDALAEQDDEEEEEIIPEEQPVQRTTHDGHIIPTHKVTVWIEDTLELSKIISDLEGLEGLEEFSDDEGNNENNNNQADDEEVMGRGVMDFNVEDLTKEFLGEN